MNTRKIKIFDLCEFNPENISKAYPFDLIHYLDISSVGSGELSLNEAISLKDAPSRAKRIIKENDSIIATVRPGNKSFYYVKNLPENTIVSTGFAVLRPKENVDGRYLYYVISNESFTNYLVANEQGANYPAVTPDIIGNKNLVVPDKDCQIKIASILSSYDDLIQNNLRRIKLLEEAAFLKYKTLKKENSLLEYTIDELCYVVMGQSPESEFYNENKEGLPFHQGVTNFNFRFVQHKIYTTKTTRIAEPNDILFSVRAPVGKLNITLDKLCIGRGLGAFRSKKNNQSYLYYQLKDYFFQIDMLGSGSIFNSVTKNELLSVKLKTLPESVIQEFESFSIPIDNQIKCLTMQNHKLKEARDILLPRLMNGEIEV